MINTMEIDGFKAIINFDSAIEMSRGEFVGLNGGADFYAADITGLKKEGAISLKVFQQMCDEIDRPYRKEFSGKFNVRIPPSIHESVVAASSAEGKSLNQWVTDAIERSLEDAA